VVYPVGIAAALCLGIGYVIQQRVACTMPISDVLHWRLLLDLMRRKMWWAGIGAMVAGQVLAGLALQLATVAVVEPLLSTNLLFALAFAAVLARQRLHWHEATGAVLLSTALGVFIAVGDPHSSPAPDTDPVAIAIAVSATAGAVLVLTVIARTANLVLESILLSAGAGLLYGFQDAATRAAFVRLDHHGVIGMLLNPWIYLVVGGAALAILLSQSAFKAARLDYSLPPIAAAEPVAGILLGITLLGDVISVSVVGIAVEAASLAAVIGAVALIGRSDSLAVGGNPHLRRRRRRRTSHG
jgi:drug/metabolite transporter (DMT)-like permease